MPAAAAAAARRRQASAYNQVPVDRQRSRKEGGEAGADEDDEEQESWIAYSPLGVVGNLLWKVFAPVWNLPWGKFLPPSIAAVACVYFAYYCYIWAMVTS